MASNSRGYSIITAALLTFTLAAAPVAGAQDDTREIDRLNERIEQLEHQLDGLSRDLKQNEQKVETMGDALEQSLGATDAPRRVTIQGYGELHYNRLNVKGGADKRQLDFHRFVLFFGYHFNDRIRLVTEVELEHSLAGDGAPGEVELEQAYIEYDLTANQQLRTGVLILPVGLLNETHEPPTFYGVERNTAENIIIPSTWWAGGVSYAYTAATGWAIDLAIHEGLAIPATADARIRSGRQKTAEAVANNWAITSRARYTGTLGLELAASLQYQSDITQAPKDGLGAATLLSLHAAYTKGGFGVRALYALWSLNTDAGETGAAVASQGSDKQSGFYIEPSYRFNERIGIFGRYEDINGGRLRDRFSQVSLGFNFWPHEGVVVKFDYVARRHAVADEKERDFDGINIGIGYHF